MLAELRMILECEELNYRTSSNLHGVIMETIRTDYAEYLHQLSLNPFSQCLIQENNQKVWCIRTITEEAYDEILIPLQKLNAFELKQGNMKVHVLEKQIKTESLSILMEEFYEAEANHYLTLSFQTPTAFKSHGRYVFYPDLKLIYRSLMKKYSEVDEKQDMFDEETLEQLIEQSEIVRYQLRTVPFPLEKIRITGFQGMICIRIKGTDTMAKFVKLLCRFGEYSGVGMKTALGMGAVKVDKEERGGKFDKSRK